MDTEKSHNEFSLALAQRALRAVEMLSPQETGTIPGATPGRGKGRETGICHGCLAPAGRRVAPGRTGNRTARTGETGRPADPETVKLGY